MDTDSTQNRLDRRRDAIIPAYAGPDPAMSLLSALRRISRTLPIGQPLLHRLRRAAGVGFHIVALLRYGLWRRSTPPWPGPVCVVGFHGSVLGIGEAARAFSDSLRAAGAEVIDWDISALFGHDVRLQGGSRRDPPAEAAALVIFLNPRELVQLVAMVGATPFRGRFCVGFWFWELETAPRSWRAAMRYIDEAWTATRFVAGAVAGQAPKALPIRTLPCPVRPSAALPDRAGFGLPEDAVVVLTAFDVRSGFTRKNPLAAVRAFRAAKALTSRRAILVCKAAGAEGAPDLFESLRAEVGEASDVRLMTDWLTGAQMGSLIASADIVLSLHRAEGFGLLPAQAMMASKAVVATGWSGNLDFMTPDNSALVDSVLIPVKDPQGLYDHGRWADPDVAQAGAKLAALIENAKMRQSLGQTAAAEVTALLDPLRLGQQARVWLGDGGALTPQRLSQQGL
jgi:glycosyltransferase involved in cell wall biosynthesis